MNRHGDIQVICDTCDNQRRRPKSSLIYKNSSRNADQNWSIHVIACNMHLKIEAKRLKRRRRYRELRTGGNYEHSTSIEYLSHSGSTFWNPASKSSDRYIRFLFRLFLTFESFRLTRNIFGTSLLSFSLQPSKFLITVYINF